MKTRISKLAAEKAFAAFVSHHAALIEETGTRPALYPPGFHSWGWTIAWEGTGTDWVFDDLSGVLSRSLFVEPVASWCLALYPADL